MPELYIPRAQPSSQRLLSPLDALEMPMSNAEGTGSPRGPNTPLYTAASRKETSSPSTTSPTSPTSPNSSPVSPIVACRDFWTSEHLDQHFGGGHGGLQTQNPRARRYSNQDLFTRQVRASVSRHKPSASYPVVNPTSANRPQLLCAAKPPFLPRGHDMQPSQFYPRPAYHISARSSFESRHKSPLSIASSADYGYESSRTSEDSNFSRTTIENELLASKAPFPPVLTSESKRALVEAVPSCARYRAGGHGRQQGQSRTRRVVMGGPQSPTRPNFGYRAPTIPGKTFKKLPEEILFVILGELKKSHLEPGSLSCATCLDRDLVNLGLSCQKWWSAVKVVLYEDIQLNGCDSVLHTKKKFKIKYGIRLKLLRRTLRERPDLADYVKSLKVPSMPDSVNGIEEYEAYIDLVASLIMACPNLERLPGFYPNYNHTFGRFVHALSTRTQLKEAVWIINPSPFQRQRRYQFSDAQSLTPTLAPAFLLPEQCNEFLSYHSNWDHLKTMFLHCNSGGMIDSLLFNETCNRLPSLENLHVSSFPEASFNDLTLTALPPLKCLRLDNLPGVTAAGLWTFASLASSNCLTSLSLVSLPLLSLPALARLFSRLNALTRFTLSQAPSPGLPIGEEIYLHPYLASSSLEYLHWEITSPDDDKATEILAKSSFHGGFPALRTIRAPADYAGTLQALCKPREKIELPGDRYRNLGPPGHFSIPSSQSMPNMPSPARSALALGHGHSPSASSVFMKSPSLSALPKIHNDSREGLIETRHKGMSLVTARRMAQNRIEASASQPKLHIIIWDEDGTPVEHHKVGGFVGLIRSKVLYTLKPDIDGMDEALVTFDGPGGLLDGGEETNVRDGCTGSWNLNLTGPGKSGKMVSGKEKWWHTERGRWKEFKLEKFF